VGNIGRYYVQTAFVLLGVLGLFLGGLHGCSAPKYLMENKGDGQDKGYILGVKSSLEKIFREPGKLKGEIGEKVIIKAARNEYESFQIILFSRKDNLQHIKLESTDFIRKDHKASIGKENASFCIVDYVETKKPIYHVDYLGWWPDPLIPLEPFDLDAERIQPIWATVRIPENTAPGQYHGTIRVLPENAEAETVEVILTVWDFDLPTKSNFQAVFSLYEHCIRDYYKYKAVPHELLLQYYSFLLAHRINPTNLYIRGRPQPRLEDLQFCIDRGLNAVNISHLDDRENKADDRNAFVKEFRQNLLFDLQQTVTFLREKQWLDRAFVYGIDEPFEHHYDAVKEMFTLAKQSAPGVRRVLTEGPVPQLYGAVDVWVPKIDNYREKRCRRRQEQGEEIWWYVCTSPHHPYPNFFLDYPAIDHRIIFWMAWKYDITGLLYYSLNRWHANYSQGAQRWPDIPWDSRTFGKHNGDGQLIYPGLSGEPYSSVRLEVIRDGLEDYEYLHALRTLMVDLKNLGLQDEAFQLQSAEDLVTAINEKAVCNRTHYTKSLDKLLIYREMVAEHIVKMTEILRKNSTSLQVKTTK
jgi:hypothetical protein